MTRGADLFAASHLHRLLQALLDLPVDSWPVLGGMGNASWAQLSGHGPVDARLPELRWRLDVWNASAQVANDVL